MQKEEKYQTMIRRRPEREKREINVVNYILRKNYTTEKLMLFMKTFFDVTMVLVKVMTISLPWLLLLQIINTVFGH